MIQEADDSMRQELLDWLRTVEPVNLPVIGGMRRHRLLAGHHEAWVQRNGRGRWTALVQRLNGHVIVCVPKLHGDLDELGFFLRFSDPPSISGEGRIIRRILPALGGYCAESIRHMILLEENLPEVPPREGKPGGSGLAAGMATADDADEIGTLMIETESFRQDGRSFAEVADSIRTGILTGGTRHVVMRLAGSIVSHACTTVETQDCALISGVTTRKDAQRRGYAACLVSFLCRQLLAEGRRPVLFCGDPAACALYMKLGFRDNGEYVTLRKS